MLLKTALAITTTRLILLLSQDNSQLETLFVCLRIALLFLDFDRPKQDRLFNHTLLLYFCAAQTLGTIVLLLCALFSNTRSLSFEVLVFIIDLIVVFSAQWK